MATRLKIMNQLLKPRGKRKPQLLEAAKKKRWDIFRGDKVQVIGTHPERGKQGLVKTVNRETDRVIVEGVNLGPKRIRGDPERNIAGTTIQEERPIHYSKVNLVDPVTGLPTRVSRRILEDGTKVRVAKKSGAVIPRPQVPKPPINSIVTESDTLDEDVWEFTYEPTTTISEIEE